MANNVGLTISASCYYKTGGYTKYGIGKNNTIEIPVNQSAPNDGGMHFWIIIIDRSDLSVKESFIFTDNSAVPSQLTPYLGNSQYFMIFTSYLISIGNLPTGALYKYLISEGAGVELKRGEQIGENLNCAVNYFANYTLVGVMGDHGGASFEGFNVYNESVNLITTLQLVPITFGGQTLYTPAALT